jgi:hypothetical protein
LRGATPAEIYFGQEPAHNQAIAPPRGRAREGPKSIPFELVYLDSERLLPILVPKSA